MEMWLSAIRTKPEMPSLWGSRQRNGRRGGGAILVAYLFRVAVQERAHQFSSDSLCRSPAETVDRNVHQSPFLPPFRPVDGRAGLAIGRRRSGVGKISSDPDRRSHQQAVL
jgi:hypothetical protein